MTVETEDPATAEVPAVPGKVDPETLALRARPARAIRFKRGVVVAIVLHSSSGSAFFARGGYSICAGASAGSARFSRR